MGRQPTANIDALVERLQADIAARSLPVGTRMKSLREMASELGATRYAMAEAYDRMVSLGFLEVRAGSGYYLAREARRRGNARPPRPLRPARQDGTDVELLVRRHIERNALLKSGSGSLPVAWLAELDVPSHIRTVASQPSSNFYQYGLERGYRPLIDLIGLRLADVQIVADDGQILLTRSISDALGLCIKALLQPGDTVLVEEPCYYNLLGLLRLAKMRLIPIRRNLDGPDLDDLERAFAQHRPKAFFLQSVLHNPTGTSMSPAIAHRLVARAAAAGCVLVEDDVYADLAGPSPLRLAALDGLVNVVYLGGFSKTISPDLRVGFIATSSERVEWLSRVKLLTHIAGSEFVEKVNYQCLERGNYLKHVERLRARIVENRVVLRDHLRASGWDIFGGNPGGLFLWARHPACDDSLPLVRQAERQGLWLAPGQAFSCADAPSPWVRFNVAFLDDRLVEWVRQR